MNAVKVFLQVSIVSVALIHLWMLALDKISIYVGTSGLALQVIYYHYLSDFPKVNHKSSLVFITLGACIAKCQ